MWNMQSSTFPSQQNCRLLLEFPTCLKRRLPATIHRYAAFRKRIGSVLDTNNSFYAINPPTLRYHANPFNARFTHGPTANFTFSILNFTFASHRLEDDRRLPRLVLLYRLLCVRNHLVDLRTPHIKIRSDLTLCRQIRANSLDLFEIRIIQGFTDSTAMSVKNLFAIITLEQIDGKSLASHRCETAQV